MPPIKDIDEPLDFEDMQEKIAITIDAAKNHYEVLGLEREATNAQINQQFKQYALYSSPEHNQKVLPDGNLTLNENSTVRLEKVNIAYKTLINPDKRKEYDAFLNAKEAIHLNQIPSVTNERKPDETPNTPLPNVSNDQKPNNLLTTLMNAFNNFCQSVSKFFNLLSSKQEHDNERKGPENN